MEKEAWSV